MKIVEAINDITARRYIFQRLYGAAFKTGWFGFGAIYASYHPDSFYVYKLHLEFKSLSRKFKKHNSWNNAGDITRLWSFILNIKQIMNENIAGDFAELGVWRGNSASVLAKIAEGTDRKVFLFDTFTGFDKRDLQGIDGTKKVTFDDTSLQRVQNVVGKENKNCRYIIGYFPQSITEDIRERRYAVVSLDCDLYDPMKAGLDFFYPRMSVGGIFLLHDYSNIGWKGAKLAIDEFCKENNEFIILMPDKSGSAFFRKSRS